MINARIIPCLLLSDGGLVKTVKFRSPRYVGDPINAIRIFNDKEVDELIVLDIEASVKGRKPNLPLLRKLASECFMPIAYGGGIKTLRDIKDIISLGIEKVIINTAAVEDPKFVQQAAKMFGSSTIIVCIDYKKAFLGGNKVMTKSGTQASPYKVEAFAALMEENGAGEIVLNSIDRDGTMGGYDFEMIEKIARSSGVPVMAMGGAGTIAHLKKAIYECNAAAAAAGSMFVFHGEHKAVLINYPEKKLLAN
jgi:imidazole glycerol-phosphate synthase subunit HisF